MKLKKYKVFEEVDPKDWGDDEYEEGNDDDLYGRPEYKRPDSLHNYSDNDYMNDNSEEIEDDDMNHLYYLLRTYLRQKGIDAQIDNKGLDITIYVILNKKEKMKSILNVFSSMKDMRSQILQQYDSEFELWETKTGDPMLTFIFELGDGDDDDNTPF